MNRAGFTDNHHNDFARRSHAMGTAHKGCLPSVVVVSITVMLRDVGSFAMNDRKNTLRKRAIIGTASVLAACTVAGGAVALSSAANAATTTPSASSNSSSAAPKNFNPGGPAPVRSDEKAVSSDDSATLSAAALKAVPGATIIRVETDAGDAAYEAHLKKSDGSLATVKFDKNLAVTKVETGMGMGDPRHHGGPGKGDPRHGGPGRDAPPNGQAPSGQAPSGQAPPNGQAPSGHAPSNTSGLGNFGG
jgi:hypothetical protein